MICVMARRFVDAFIVGRFVATVSTLVIAPFTDIILGTPVTSSTIQVITPLDSHFL